MPFKLRTNNIVIKEMARWERRIFNILLLTAFGLVVVRLWWPMNLPGKAGWPGAVLLLLAAAGTVAALARQLPLQNVLFAASVIALAGGAATWLDLKTGVPFGPLLSISAGPKLFGTLPWPIPVVWVVAVLNSRGVARLILRPWRKIQSYGFQLIGLTAGLAALFDLALEPFATRVKDYWFWEPTRFPVTWQGAPLVNSFGWAVVTLLVLAFVTPLLINKRPTPRQPPDFYPLAIWLGGIFLFAAGCASAGLWLATALDVVIAIVTAVFAVRGSRW
jgi:uncharacterized membrane protein